ncbi:MAG: MATE family efflux transporter [Pseudomonadota bacterium]
MERLPRIFALALPIIGGMVSQNVLNLVDTAMVGRLESPAAALGAVGLGGFANFAAMALILGLATGVQATAARRKGEERFDEMARPLNAGLTIALVVAPLLSLVLYLLTPAFYPWLVDDPAVVELGVPYLQIRLLSMVFVAMNFAFRGYWNAVDMARVYMGTLVVMHAVNIALNYVLIFGHFGAPALGVTGAGLASALSTMVGTGVYLTMGWRHARGAGFLAARPKWQELRRLIGLSLPSSVQQLAFSMGMLTTFVIVGQLGTLELGAANILINVMLVVLLPGMGFGLASATLVGQALGRDDAADAARWGWDVCRVSALALTVLAVPIWAAPEWIIGLFLGADAGNSLIEVARFPMRLVGLSMTIEAAGMVFMHSLLGAGDTRRVMFVAVSMQWGLFLPVAWLIGPVLGGGLTAVWLAQIIYRALQTAVFWRLWVGRRWSAVTV